MHGTATQRWGVSALPTHAASWLLLVFSGGTVLSAALQRLLVEQQQSSQRLVELNVGEMFAAAGVMSLLYAARHLRPALTRVDRVVLLVCSLAWFVPEPHAVYGGMTLAGGWFAAKSSRDRLLTGLGQVWLALSFYELWSKLVFKLFYQAIEPFEVGLMFEVGRLFYGGISMSGVNLRIRGDWSVVILEGCSSLHNLSLTALIWLCVLKIAGRTWGLGAVQVLLVSAGLVVAINIARILLMLPSFAAYHFWHNGQGSTATALASVLASVVPILLYVERTPCLASRQT